MLNDRPVIPLKRTLDAPAPDGSRPLSAFALDYRGAGSSSSGNGILDVDMPDAGPSTAPLQQSGGMFFRDP